MEGGNQSGISEFILLGLSDQPEQQRLLLFLFLLMYLITGLGNLLIMMAISCDPHLHTPMYFFLSNLSLVDIGFISTTIPKMLNNHISKNRTIPYAGCLTQVFFFIWFGGIDSVLLAAMAYDLYVAICAPLHYSTIMTPRVCAFLVLMSWLWAYTNSLTHTVLLTRLSFCDHSKIPHFFCDLGSLLKLACSDTFINDLMFFTGGAITTILPFIGILISYGHIFMAVLRISSVSGKQRVFSTCGSHLTVVCLFYETIIGVYFSPTSTHTAQQDTAATVMYTVVTPMLNPFIYSLRNKDMKGALKMLITRKPGFTL
ncbi:olfactory receptor 1361-like [Sarcophilus harrisii]|uniref:G-protein coupled receptors family 1 profile domain-containing protein n=1 Tax=Sarcophilus harrisii TaxID=9305 RepID=A0A7N4P221_SARHA|nr:olfactory receptor 1361-like [Sarcophilus harrisii]